MKKRDIVQFCGDIVSPLTSVGRLSSSEFKDAFINSMKTESTKYICGQGRYRNIYLPLCAMIDDFAKLDHSGMINRVVRDVDVECIRIDLGSYLFLFNNGNRTNGAFVDLAGVGSDIRDRLTELRIDAVVFESFKAHTVYDIDGKGFNDGYYIANQVDNSESFHIPAHLVGFYNKAGFDNSRRVVHIMIGYSTGFTRNNVSLDRNYTNLLIEDNSTSRLMDAMRTCNVSSKEHSNYLYLLTRTRYMASYANRVFIKNCTRIKDEIN